MENKITYISIDKLIPHPQNPRKELGDLTELADSIKANGVYQNLTVVEDGDDTYKIIIGHRRHAAAKIAGLTELPCVIAEMTMRQQLETMLLENMQRSDLTVIEEAQGLQLLIDLGDSVADIAASTGFSKKKIKSRLLLNSYTAADVEKAFRKGATLEDYVKLSRIKDESKRMKCAKHLGTSNFKYYVDGAIAEEKWESEKPKILAVLKEFNAVETGCYLSCSEYYRKHGVGTAKEAREFCENNPQNRQIKYRIPSYYNEIEIYLMKTEDEIKDLKPEDNNDNKYRAAIGTYRNCLIKRLNKYIEGFVIGLSDNQLDLSDSGRLVAIAHILRTIFTVDLEDSHNYAPTNITRVMMTLGTWRDKAATSIKSEFVDYDYEIHPDNTSVKALARNPIRVLLTLLIGGVNLERYSSFYAYDTQYKCVKYNKSRQPARVFECLEWYGFETPDELRQYIDGTHPMYSEEGCRQLMAEEGD